MEAQIEQQLEKILPEDLARAFESAYHVFQGNHEHIDDLLKNGAVLLRKAAKRFSSTQMIVGIAALAAVAVVIINRSSDDDHEGDAQDVSRRDDKRQLGGKDQNKDKDQEKK